MRANQQQSVVEDNPWRVTHGIVCDVESRVRIIKTTASFTWLKRVLEWAENQKSVKVAAERRFKQLAPKKPCPFCGGEPRFNFVPDAKPELENGFWVLGCKNRNCLVAPIGTGDSLMEAFSAWDTRQEAATAAPVTTDDAAV